MRNANRKQAPPAELDSIFRTGDVLGDAWSWLVMREAVLHDVRRFSQFQARLGVARSTLTGRLGQLTAGGLLAERQRPPGPEYHLTESGRDFLGCLMVAMRWADHWYFDEATRPTPAIHGACGQPLETVLRCRHCHRLVFAREVTARRRGPFTASPPAPLRRRTPDLSLLERERTCSIARTLSVIGDLWTSLIIRESFFGTRRFDDFQRHLNIAPNILSGRLKRLVDQQVLFKSQYDDWPVRHEYRLTERGLDLYHVPLAMHTWGRRWIKSDDSDIHLTHKSCGADPQPILTCDRCGDAITRDDIHLQAHARDHEQAARPALAWTPNS
jgi:DNA-binding HxlR family transcriptional regulator